MILTAFTYGFLGCIGVAVAKVLFEYLAKKLGSEPPIDPALPLLKARNVIGRDQVSAIVTIGETIRSMSETVRTIEMHMDDMLVSGVTIPSPLSVVAAQSHRAAAQTPPTKELVNSLGMKFTNISAGE